MRSGRFRRNRSLTNHGHRALRLENLESRQLLSVSPVGSEAVVGPATNNSFDEFYKDLAADAAGNVTVVWERFVEEQRLDIFARRYDAAGNPLGSEFRVNAYTAGDQSKPAIAVNDAGQTVITWQSNQQDGDGWGIYASFYDAGGNLLSGDVLVNTTTAGDAVNPDVDISNAGRVMFAWGPYSTFRFFDASGNAVGDEFGEVFATDRNYVGFDAAGGYVRGGFDRDVFVWRRYTANDIQVPDTLPTVLNRLPLPGGSASYDFAMNSSGEFIAASFAQKQVYVQRVSATDELIDLPVTVPTIVNLPQFDVDLDEAGNLAVGTVNFEWSPSNSWTSVHVFNADNTLNDVLTFGYGKQIQTQAPAVGFTGIGAGVILHNLYVPSQPDYAILTAQRFATDSLTITGLVGAGMEFLRADVIAPVEVRELEVRLSRAASTAAGAAGLHSVLNPANWQLWRGNENVSSLIATIGSADGRVKLTLAGPLPTGNYRLVASDAIQDSEGNALDGNGDGLPGGAAERRFVIGAVQPVGEPIKTDNRQAIEIVANSSGQFATVTLRSSQIRVQFYDAQGVPTGSELRLASNVVISNWTKPRAFLDGAGNLHVFWTQQGGQNFWATYNSAGALQRPIVSMPLNMGPVDMGDDGRVVVLTTSGVQLINADGTLNGSHIPTASLGAGNLVDVAILKSGDVVVAEIQDRYMQDDLLYVHRISASGQRLGSPTLVQSFSAIDKASLTSNPDGGFAVGWQTSVLAPELPHEFPRITRYLRQINVRLFDANAAPLGDSILVASDTVATPLAENPASAPVIDFDGAGRFVVAWQQADLDGNLPGIGARGFLADGTPLGPAFRVNVPQVGVQAMPALAVNSGGQLAIGWLDQGWSRTQFFALFELPTVDLNGDAPGLSFAKDFTPSDFSLPVAGELTIAAAESGPLFGAQVRIRSFVSGDVLLVDTSGTSLSATFDNGLLTISGEADLATYEQVLRTVRFEAAASRLTGERIDVDFQVDFGLLTSAVSTAALALYLPGSVSIVNRSLFYNNSLFDGSHDISPRDALALAIDKVAYLPGSGPSTFANISSYARGINGLMIDLSASHGAVSLADFSFRVGSDDQLDSWQTALPPNAFAITALDESTHRITITWHDGWIGNTWLEIRMRGNANTGLAADDVFYFGHRMGDTGLGNSAAAAITSAADVLAVRNNAATGVGITNPFDFNRDKQVNAGDELRSRNWAGLLLMLDLPATEGLNAAPLTASSTRLESEHAGESRGPGLAAVASALSRPDAAPVVSQAVVLDEVIATRPVSSPQALNAQALAVAIEQEMAAAPAKTAAEAVTSDELLSPLLPRLGR